MARVPPGADDGSMNTSRGPSPALLGIGTAVALVAALIGPSALAGPAEAAAAPAPPVKISQNALEAAHPGAGVACHFNSNLAENHWYRRFDLNGHYGVSKGFAVSQLVVAVEKAFSVDGTLPGQVAVSAIDHGDPLLLANLEPLASVPVDYESVADGTLLKVPVTAVVPAGKDLVVEAVVQAGTDSELFRVGANSAPEVADDYLRADVCDYTQPTPFASIGWPSQNHVLYAVGKATDCVDAETAATAAGAALGPATTQLAMAKQAKAGAVAGLRKARRALKKAVAHHAVGSPQVVAARARVAKAKKKQAAKAKALKAATAALTAASAAVTASERSAASECAQPPLPGVN
jgi:hypothetical protein